jgi:enoyl-CoA hydratase
MKDYSEFPSLDVEQAGKNGDIFIVSINRPERLNAIDPETHTQIGRIWRELDRDPACRVIIFTGKGKAFCAGLDFKATHGESARPQYRTLRGRPGASKIIDYVLEVEKPIITMINGHAVGMGLILALLGDITVASTTAKLGDNHVDIAVPPGDGGVLLLPMLLGMNRAKELLLTGEILTGEAAEKIGLVNHAVPLDELRDFTMKIAEKLAEKAPYAMRTTKASLNMILRRRALDVLDLAHLYEQLALRTDDHKEAMRAFSEKRKAKYSGR